MKMQSILISEMVKYMLSIFGLSKNVIYNTIGITKEEFKVEKQIKISYDDDVIKNYPIFSATAMFENSKLHVVGTSLIDEDDCYFAALFKLDDLFTYGIKVNYNNPDEEPIFLVSKAKNSWSNLAMYDKIIACAGLEKLNDAGLHWKPEPMDDFYNILIELVEM